LYSRPLDLILSTDGTYKAMNWAFVFRMGWWRMTGKQFIAKYNGVHSVPGAGVVGSLKRGTYSVKFKVVYQEDQSPAAVPYMPMTFYDVDGNKERTGTCDAASAAVHRPTNIGGGCSGGCCNHSGSRFEVNTPSNWEALTSQQKGASVTYFFQDKSEFTFKYTTTYEHRIFLFKGSKVVACKDA